MAVPTVNVTCTVTNQTGAVVAGATVTAQLTGIDLYGTNYIFPSVQSFVTDGAGFVTMPLFPNALGARRTAYQFIAIDPVTGRALINITAVVPNQNIDLSVLDAINKLPAYAPPLTQPFSATLTSLASLGVAVGSILFGGSGQSVIQDSANLFWDNTNKRLGIGNAAPTKTLDVTGSIQASGKLTILSETGAGDILLGVGSAAGAPRITINGGTNSSTGPLVHFQRGGLHNFYLGHESVVIGNNSNDAVLYTSDQFKIYAGDALRMTVGTGGAVAIPGSVMTPLVTGTTGSTLKLGTNGDTGDWEIDTSGNFKPVVGFATADLGTATTKVRSGYFSTSVVTPKVSSSGNSLIFQANSIDAWVIQGTGANFDFLPNNSDNFQSMGAVGSRIKQVFTPILDSGTTGALSLRTNNGATQFSATHTANAVNFPSATGSATGAGTATFFAAGTDANITFQYGALGTGGHAFYSAWGAAVQQFGILHTAFSTQWPTATGGNGVNSKIGTSAGGLDFTSATIRYPNIGTTANAANATLNAVGSNDLLRSTSSKRYKTEIEVLSRDEALTLLRKLNPITYASMSEHDDPYTRHSGFIAEEVFDINPLFVSLSMSSTGKKRPESVQYERLTVPLVAGWQDHDARLAALEARIH